MDNTAPIPSNVITGILLAVVYRITIIILWALLGMYNSQYYSFGPSEHLVLAFTNVTIDTWSKYTGIVMQIFVGNIIKVISGDFVYYWINSSVLNPDLPVRQVKGQVYIITNFYWFLNAIDMIFFFALSFAQVDLALYAIISSTLAGLYASYKIIYDKNRDSLYQRDSMYGAL